MNTNQKNFEKNTYSYSIALESSLGLLSETKELSFPFSNKNK